MTKLIDLTCGLVFGLGSMLVSPPAVVGYAALAAQVLLGW